VISNFTNVSPDSLLGPDNPCTRYVGNSFLITWWQYLFDVTRWYRNLSYIPVVSNCVRLGGRSVPFADRHYERVFSPVQTFVHFFVMRYLNASLRVMSREHGMPSERPLQAS